MMVTNEQMKRLEALERDARVRRMEADLEAMRPQAEEVARKFGCTPEAVLRDAAEIIRRIAEIGEEAAYGTMVEELRSGEFAARLDREWEAWQEERRRRSESGVIVWHGGTPPIPYDTNGEIVRDEHGEPLKFR
jgi:hypothetical protein